MSKDDISLILPPIQAILASIQENEIAQIVMFSLSIACAVLEIVYRLYKWFKEAKKDGKIDKEEIEELIEIGEDGIDRLNDTINKKEGE